MGSTECGPGTNMASVSITVATAVGESKYSCSSTETIADLRARIVEEECLDPKFTKLFCGFTKLEEEDNDVLVKELEEHTIPRLAPPDAIEYGFCDGSPE